MDMASIADAVKVVLVDSGTEAESFITERLLDNKYICVRHESATEALAYIEMYASQVALILVNVQTPSLDMEQFMDFLSDNGTLDSIPVIAMDEHPIEEQKNAAYDLGIADYLDIAKQRDSAVKRVRNMLKVYLEARAREIFQTEYDPLTGALNLDGLRRRFQESLFLDPKYKYMVVYTDLMDFKYFNSLFGFEAGNELLKYWISSIEKHCQKGDMIARISGDRVVVVKPRDEDETEKDPLYDILSDVREHFVGEFGEYEVNIVSGVYCYIPANNRGESLDEMIGYARQAEKSLKGSEHSGSMFFDDQMWESQQRRLEINGHVEAALANGEIFLNLQPQYNCVTGELIGAECLCRWIHKTRGFISPGEFIPALEESGKIYDVDYFVWESACKLIRKWLDEGIRISLSVNVSRKDLDHADLPEVFMELIKKYDLTPDLLRIEITETAYMDDAGRLTELIRQFAKLGFTVEMDDFGSGFSSLNLLHKTDVDILKLDMGFLSDESASAKGGSIISALVKMAHALDMKVLAEGVETEEQAQFLREIGCIMVQGYFFSRPIPVEEFEKLIHSSNIEEISRNYVRYQLFNIQELFDRNSSGFFIFNNCMGPAAMFEYDGKRLEPVVVNDDFIDLVDWNVADIGYAKDLLGEMPEPHKTKAIEMLQKAFDEETCSYEIHTDKTGKDLHAQIRYIFSRDENKMYFVELNDISKEKALEKSIAELEDTKSVQQRWYEEKLKVIYEMFGIVLYEYDPVQDLMTVTVRRDNGEISVRDAKNYTTAVRANKWVHPDDVEKYIGILRKTVLTGENQTVVVRAYFADGNYYSCKYFFTPVKDNKDRTFKVIGRAEQIEELDQLKKTK